MLTYPWLITLKPIKNGMCSDRRKHDFPWCAIVLERKEISIDRDAASIEYSRANLASRYRQQG